MKSRNILMLLFVVLGASTVRPSRAAEPWVAAQRWAIVDAQTGTLLAGEEPFEAQSVASLTKVMTAIVAIERGYLDMNVTITQGDLVGDRTAELRPGSVVTLKTLINGMLLTAGDDAAMAIARAVGGSATYENTGARQQFINWMNDKAAELGLQTTHYENAYGHDEDGDGSSAYDTALIMKFAMTLPDFVDAAQSPLYSGDGYSFWNSNDLPQMMDGVLGGATSWGNGCGHCLAEVAERDGRQIIAIVLDSNDNGFNDAENLLNFGWSLPYPADTADRAQILFGKLWDRTDKPVEDGQANRSWLWGKPLGPVEALQSDTNQSGLRFKRLFEKGLMEINNPYSQLDSGWYITPGLLAQELIEGQAGVPLAGDLDSSSPTYADLSTQHWQPSKTGDSITAFLAPGGTLEAQNQFAQYGVKAGAIDAASGHTIASVFEDFMNATGSVLVDDQIRTGRIFDPPLLAIGYPITEPFWIQAPVNGQAQDILIQCFERRCLTYTPGFESEWRLEMSNIGLHWTIWKGLRESVGGPLPGPYYPTGNRGSIH